MNSLRLRLAGGRGFSLIEVLIAVAVLGIGLLAVAALQIQGVRQNFDSYARSQAVMLANDYAERMYANRPGTLNRPGAPNSDYADFDSSTVDCGSTPTVCGTQSDVAAPSLCDPAALALYDRYVVACGYVAEDAPNGRVGGVRDLLQNGTMTVTALVDGSGNCLDPVTGVTAPPPCPARHQISMTWDEQIKGADNRSTVQPATLVMTVQP